MKSGHDTMQVGGFIIVMRLWRAGGDLLFILMPRRI